MSACGACLLALLTTNSLDTHTFGAHILMPDNAVTTANMGASILECLVKQKAACFPTESAY